MCQSRFTLCAFSTNAVVHSAVSACPLSLTVAQFRRAPAMKIVSSAVRHPSPDTQAAEPEFVASAGVRRRELPVQEPISPRFQFDPLGSERISSACETRSASSTCGKDMGTHVRLDADRGLSFLVVIWYVLLTTVFEVAGAMVPRLAGSVTGTYRATLY